MRNNAELVAIVLSAALAEWFLYGYVPHEKISPGEKFAYAFLIVCAVGWLLVVA
ncbi:MAG TPA: hypothetical protein VN678_08935 [Acidobacteriaceae bacterium]|nr:hypothetical protein [Acidobacteriaceae bacterium]